MKYPAIPNNLSHGQVTTSTNPAIAIEGKIIGLRKKITILNIDTSIVIYIGSSIVTASNGFPLLPGASQTLSFYGNVWAVAASGTPKLAWIASEILD
jgi:hypothetical protein